MTRLEYLESLLPKSDYESKYRNNFEKYARYMGNGIYSWRELYANNPRLLFVQGVLILEKIKFKDEDENN